MEKTETRFNSTFTTKKYAYQIICSILYFFLLKKEEIVGNYEFYVNKQLNWAN